MELTDEETAAIVEELHGLAENAAVLRTLIGDDDFPATVFRAGEADSA